MIGSFRKFAGAAAAALAVAGCSGQQSAINPKGPDAAQIAELFWAMVAVGSLILLGVLVLLGTAIVRARRARTEQSLSHERSRVLVLVGGVALPVVVGVILVVASLRIGGALDAAPVQVASIQVTGRQWWWEIRYLDDQGRVLAITANEMAVPLGEPVRLLLVSDNVIHSFWVPNLQGKTDLIPGRINESWLQAEEPGIFRGQCAEFCGTQHAHMGFLVEVLQPQQFAAWLDHQRQPAAKPRSLQQARGAAVFLAASCPACHTIRGTQAAGELGPDLTHLASRRTLAAATLRNTRGYLAGWILDPQHVKPGALMPPTPLEPDDLQALLHYLQSLR